MWITFQGEAEDDWRTRAPGAEPAPEAPPLSLDDISFPDTDGACWTHLGGAHRGRRVDETGPIPRFLDSTHHCPWKKGTHLGIPKWQSTQKCGEAVYAHVSVRAPSRACAPAVGPKGLWLEETWRCHVAGGTPLRMGTRGRVKGTAPASKAHLHTIFR